MVSQQIPEWEESVNKFDPAHKSPEQEAKERILADLQPLYHGAWAHMNLNRVALFGRNITEATSGRNYERFRVALTEYSRSVHPLLKSLAQQFQCIPFDPMVVEALRFHADELMKTVGRVSDEPGIAGDELARMEVEIPGHVDQLLDALRVMRGEIFRAFRCRPQEVLRRGIEQWSQGEQRTTFFMRPPLIDEAYGVAIEEHEFEELLNRFVKNTVGRVGGDHPREIVFSGARREDRWNFEIRDSHTLLPLRMWKLIFTPSGNDTSQGGLSTVPALLQKYDADVCVKASSEETGTVFLIRFQVVKEPSVTA